MPVGLPKRLSVTASLAAAYVGYIALTLTDTLRDAAPALATLSAMWMLGVATYPREAPKGWDWLAPVMVVVMGAATMADAVILCRTAGHYAGRTDFDGLTLLGMGLVGASCVRHVQLLMDDSRTWSVTGKPPRAVGA